MYEGVRVIPNSLITCLCLRSAQYTRYNMDYKDIGDLKMKSTNIAQPNTISKISLINYSKFISSYGLYLMQGPNHKFDYSSLGKEFLKTYDFNQPPDDGLKVIDFICQFGNSILTLPLYDNTALPLKMVEKLHHNTNSNFAGNFYKIIGRVDSKDLANFIIDVLGGMSDDRRGLVNSLYETLEHRPVIYENNTFVKRLIQPPHNRLELIRSACLSDIDIEALYVELTPVNTTEQKRGSMLENFMCNSNTPLPLFQQILDAYTSLHISNERNPNSTVRSAILDRVLSSRVSFSERS